MGLMKWWTWVAQCSVRPTTTVAEQQQQSCSRWVFQPSRLIARTQPTVFFQEQGSQRFKIFLFEHKAQSGCSSALTCETLPSLGAPGRRRRRKKNLSASRNLPAVALPLKEQCSSVAKHLSARSLKQTGSGVPVAAAGVKGSPLNAVYDVTISRSWQAAAPWMTCGAPTEAAPIYTRRATPSERRLAASTFTHCRRHSFPPTAVTLLSHIFSPAATLFSRSFSLSRPVSFADLPLCRPTVALPLSCHIPVYFCQSDAGTRCSGPTRHRDSNNCLTRENKFRSQTRILMDWPGFFCLFFFLPFSFLLVKPFFFFFFFHLPPPYFGLLLPDGHHLLS